MSFRTILAPMAYERSAKIALEGAVILARMFNAHINAVHVRFDTTGIMPYVIGPTPAELLVQISENAEKVAKERALAVRAVFDAVVKDAGIKVVDHAARGATPSAAWRESLGSFDYRYGVEGRVHDLAVAPRPEANDLENRIDVLEGLLFNSGRPVLMLPPSLPKAIGSTVAIAWNGGVEATRAVAAALPFLEQAKRVMVLTVDGEELDGPSAKDLVDSLAWHGVSADTVQTREEGLSDGKTILKAAGSLSADLLVMGAYSHSRLRELILGGVTQDVVEAANMPVLMTH
ncbi:MAG: universal stress protein [Sphingomonadales bacterium]|nr:universal stress protein [Sphingomonadales bacterium]